MSTIKKDLVNKPSTQNRKTRGSPSPNQNKSSKINIVPKKAAAVPESSDPQ